jgi:hypothetical protein
MVVGASWFAWARFRPPPCTGGVFIEFRPPLTPGRYQFRLELDGGDRICEFEALPDGTARKTHCKMPLEITTQMGGAEPSIISVTLGAAPEHLHIRVKQDSRAIYDTALEPEYAPYATRREDSKRFCGDRAFLKPSCIRGTLQCTPFRPTCTGTEDCSASDVCCASPEWGREYGAKAATQCSSTRACLDRFGRIACKKDADCPDGHACNDASLSAEFDPPLKACGSRAY